MKGLSIKILIISVIVLVIIFTSYKILSSDNERQSINVSFALVEKGNIENVVIAQGVLEPKEYVDVGAQVSGQLKKLFVNIGDEVKKGELIAEIDPDIFRLKVSGDAARIKIMQADRLQVLADLQNAEKKASRYQKLLEAKNVSHQDYEDAETAVKILHAKIKSLDAQIEEAKSSLESNKTNLTYTKIYAPISGTVVLLNTKQGQTLNANQTTPVIVQIADLGVMTVKAQITEADISKIKSNMPVSFSTLGARDKLWHGKVRQILPTPEIINDVVLYGVLVDVENKNHELMMGMTTQMFFAIGVAKDVLVIPTSSLIRQVDHQKNSEAYIVQVNSHEGLIEKTVQIGLSDRKNSQVLSGLKLGEQVAIPKLKNSTTTSQNKRMRVPRL